MSFPRRGMGPEDIRAILDGYFAPLPEGIEFQIAKYMELMEVWGKKMSLTAVKDTEDIVRRHFGESIFALSLIDLRESRLADVGTGAGFPGLALKLAEPSISVTLIEPNKKKCAFLHEIVRSLELKDVTVVPSGFESAGIGSKSLSAVASRALGIDRKFLNWVGQALDPGGNVLLWVGEEDAEKVAATAGWDWRSPDLIPGTKGRYILRGNGSQE